MAGACFISFRIGEHSYSCRLLEAAAIQPDRNVEQTIVAHILHEQSHFAATVCLPLQFVPKRKQLVIDKANLKSSDGDYTPPDTSWTS